MKVFAVIYDRRRGMSLAETAVTLAIIMLVTGATVSLLISSSNAEDKAADTVHIVNTAENAVECFRFALSEEEFYDAVKLTDIGFEKVAKCEYILEKSRYTVTVRIDYSDNSMNISAIDEDGTVIYSLYYKGE